MSPATPLPAAVVTVSYNSSAELDVFLRSVKESETVEIPVTIADNSSADLDETRRIAAEHGATVLALEQNLGYGGAINAAVRSLPDEVRFVLISNPDVALHSGAISTLVDAILANPKIGAVGPKVLNADGSVYPSARKVPSLRTGIGHAMFTRMWPTNPWSRSYKAERELGETSRTVGWLSGSCLLIRRDAFEQIGGFDDAFFMYFEDVDLGYRMDRAGWLNLYAPTAVVTHTGAHSTSTESARMLRAHHQSAYRFLARKYRGWYLAPVRWVLWTGLAFRAWWLTRD